MSRSICQPRGQTITLFALTLLLLTLLVCMTLSFGTKAKEKMELQIAADAAAYSNAVVTARTYNVLSVLNRVQVAEMVSMAGVQSFTSWAGAYRGALGASMTNYVILWALNYLPHLFDIYDPLFGCSWANTGQIFGDRLSNLMAEEDRISGLWDPLDIAAAAQTVDLQSAARFAYAAQLLQYNGALKVGSLNNQSLGNSLLDQVRAGDPFARELNAPSSGDSVTIREGASLLPVGAAMESGIFSRPEVWASMGSRGHPFTTGRFGGNTWDTSFDRIIPQSENTSLELGSAYFDTNMTHAASANGKFSWADDHGGVVTKYQEIPCVGQPTFAMPLFGNVLSTEKQDTTDQHQWFPQINGDSEPPEVRHTFPNCILCPGIWPLFMDYNWTKVWDKSDAFAQPKNFSVMQRDYAARPAGMEDPWNLLFHFRTSASAPGETFDIRDSNGIILKDGTDVSRQTVLATGIAYYHRSGSGPLGNHWKEPPNFFNPFWRAGLVHPDVDAQGQGNDVPNTLNDVGAAWAADTYNELRSNGFQGIQ
jgi:hypothetical protein